MLKSSGGVAVATMGSRVLGLVREIAYAGFMGDTWVAGSFIFAFLIPNLFRRLLGEGALSAVFIPLFKQKEKMASQEAMWECANAVLSGFLVAATALVLLGLAGISALLHWGEFPAKTILMLELLRIMFPYMLLICLTAIFSAMLNARGQFFLPALSPSILNLVMIGSVLWLAPRLGSTLSAQIFGLAAGVVVAGLLQAAFQLPLLHREGFRYRWTAPWSNQSVAQVVRQMIPGILGAAAFQINLLLSQGLAYWIDPSVVASFYYAVRLMELPQGVVGLSLAAYLLPTLSGLAAEKKYPEFRATLREGLGHLFVINLLASILLVLLSDPIIRLLFERGQFDSASTARASLALVCLAPGLIAFSLATILARAFYALGDIRTPMQISVFCLALNLLLVALLIARLRQAALGLASTLSAGVNVGLLLYALRRKLRHLDLKPLRQTVFRTFPAGLAGGALAWLAARLWNAQLGHDSFLLRLGAVFVPITLSGAVYLGLGLALRVDPILQLVQLAFGRSRGRRARH